MLSLIIVVFCVFATIRGEECVKKQSENEPCHTKCGEADLNDCGFYLRKNDGEPTHEACPAGEVSRLCKPVKKIVPNWRNCMKIEDWRKILWDVRDGEEAYARKKRGVATDAEMGTGKLTDATVKRNNYFDWFKVCKIEKATEDPEDLQKCSDYQGRGAVSLSIGPKHRDFMFITTLKADGTRTNAVIKFCKGHSFESDEERTKKDEFIQEIKDDFGKEYVARAIERGEAIPAARAHEEYVDNLWEEVNEIEEDELRYERAWDKLRRAQRSFDMATKLRQLRKKKLRKYYN